MIYLDESDRQERERKFKQYEMEKKFKLEQELEHAKVKNLKF